MTLARVSVSIFTGALVLMSDLSAGTAGAAAPAVSTEATGEERACLVAAEKWLTLIDKRNYGMSWEAAAEQLRSTMPKGDWEIYLNQNRAPLGVVTARRNLGQAPAEKSPELPEGACKIVSYRTAFADKSIAKEMITVHLEANGSWKTVAYDLELVEAK